MLGVAFALGFRFEGGIAAGCWRRCCCSRFSYSFSWIQALIGLSVKSVEAANSAGFMWMFPLTFISSAFVDTETDDAAGCSASPTPTRSRSPPTRAVRSTTAPIPATRSGCRSPGRWG